MSDFWHFLAHVFRLHGCELEHRPHKGHTWLWTVCVTCWSATPLTHSTTCDCAAPTQSKEERHPGAPEGKEGGERG